MMQQNKTEPFRIFESEKEKAEKERERAAIRALLTAKEPRLSKIKTTSVANLKELADAMYHHTNSNLPNSLAKALEGKAAEAADSFLKQIPKPTLQTPVK